jgi:hypothetical protein
VTFTRDLNPNSNQSRKYVKVEVVFGMLSFVDNVQKVKDREERERERERVRTSFFVAG